VDSNQILGSSFSLNSSDNDYHTFSVPSVIPTPFPNEPILPSIFIFNINPYSWSSSSNT